jgi:hypothetical protein
MWCVKIDNNDLFFADRLIELREKVVEFYIEKGEPFFSLTKLFYENIWGIVSTVSEKAKEGFENELLQDIDYGIENANNEPDRHQLLVEYWDSV